MSLSTGQLKWKQVTDQVKDMLQKEGAVPAGGSGEEATLLEVINEYRKRMEGKLCVMEEKYQVGGRVHGPSTEKLQLHECPAVTPCEENSSFVVRLYFFRP